MGLTMSMCLFEHEYGNLGVGYIVSVGLFVAEYSNMEWGILLAWASLSLNTVTLGWVIL